MTDIGDVLDNLFADWGADVPSPLPTLPTSLPTGDIAQRIDIIGNSHTSHSSHQESDKARKTHDEKPENANFSAAESRVTSSYDGAVGSVGSGVKTLAESTLPFFPLDFEGVGSVGSESGSSKRPFLDLNSAKPQRSDWWTGNLMVEADHVAPPPGSPLPISPAEIHAGVTRELRALAEDGRTGPDALRDAVEITVAKIRNSVALAETQAMDGRCHVCREPLDGTRPEVAVMQGGSSTRLHIHSACHADHKARRTALVDRIMAAAGYGRTQADGEAA